MKKVKFMGEEIVVILDKSSEKKKKIIMRMIQGEPGTPSPGLARVERYVSYSQHSDNFVYLPLLCVLQQVRFRLFYTFATRLISYIPYHNYFNSQHFLKKLVYCGSC